MNSTVPCFTQGFGHLVAASSQTMWWGICFSTTKDNHLLLEIYEPSLLETLSCGFITSGSSGGVDKGAITTGSNSPSTRKIKKVLAFYSQGGYKCMTSKHSVGGCVRIWSWACLCVSGCKNQTTKQKNKQNKKRIKDVS